MLFRLPQILILTFLIGGSAASFNQAERAHSFHYATTANEQWVARYTPLQNRYYRGAQRYGTKPLDAREERFTEENTPPTYEREDSKVVKVGLLVPLKGKGEDIGKHLQDAAILALFDKYGIQPSKTGVTVEIIPKNTSGTARGAARAAEEAIEQGAKLLIGPLYSHAVSAAAQVAKRHGINILSFSNNPEVIEPGVFLFGYNAEKQVRRVAEYAFGNNVTKLAILAPNNAYGQTVTKVMREVSEPYGARIYPVRYYGADGASLKEDIRSFIKKGVKGGRPLFEALFVPESGQLLQQIVEGLQDEGVPLAAIRMISTGVWDDAKLQQALPQLQGGWYASTPPEPFNVFRGRFVATYDYEPIRLASLSYDAIALVATLAETGGLTAARLTHPYGYMGPANGIFRITKEGMTERGLSVIEIRPDGETRALDLAPKKFGN